MSAARLYISGPMSGKFEMNFPAFNAEAARLRAAGYDVVNPAELNPDTSAKWEDCLRSDIKALMDCNAIVLLPGWEDSKGARLEFHIADALGFAIFYAGQLIAGDLVFA